MTLPSSANNGGYCRCKKCWFSCCNTIINHSLSFWVSLVLKSSALYRNTDQFINHIVQRSDKKEEIAVVYQFINDIPTGRSGVGVTAVATRPGSFLIYFNLYTCLHVKKRKRSWVRASTALSFFSHVDIGDAFQIINPISFSNVGDVFASWPRRMI